MLRGIYTAASGMINTQKKQDATANNIANSSTPGYKGDRVVAQSFGEVLLQNSDKTVLNKPAAQKLGHMTFGVQEGEVYTDFAQGPLKETGMDLDFAINGRGFFTLRYLEGEDASIRYTRDGSFSIDSDGRVVTSDGAYLVARDVKTGDMVPMEVGSGEVKVDDSGRVYVDSVEKYRLVISDFSNYDGISKVGHNMYAVSGQGTEVIERNLGEYEIKQGMLEQSNIDMVSEMTNMITNLRSYQANQRVIQSIDETLGKAVNEVGALR